MNNPVSGSECSSEPMLQGSPTVLVVDDEEIMRDVASIIFEDHGATVFEAEDGESALEIFKEKVDEIELVCMDFSMPNKNGYETFIEMRKLKPSILCVFISGLAITPEIQQLLDAGEVAFLAKPFKELELIKEAQALRETRGA